MEIRPQPPTADGGLVPPAGIGRRQALRLMAAGAGLLTLAACGRSSDPDPSAATATTGSSAGTGATSTSSTSAASGTTAATDTLAVIPEETAGPYPGDGSNGPDVLAQDGVVRRDLRSSFGSASGTAEGVPLTIVLTVLDSAAGHRPLAGGAVYLWHCDREGGYSMYSNGIEDENYLRGVQEVADDGTLSFLSSFPGAYSGRWPHLHFKVYAGADEATGGGRARTTSQLALPEDVCAAVYATAGYESSVRNLAGTSLSADNVFRDGHDLQLATVTGDTASGYTARLTVVV